MSQEGLRAPGSEADEQKVEVECANPKSQSTAADSSQKVGSVSEPKAELPTDAPGDAQDNTELVTPSIGDDGVQIEEGEHETVDDLQMFASFEEQAASGRHLVQSESFEDALQILQEAHERLMRLCQERGIQAPEIQAPLPEPQRNNQEGSNEPPDRRSNPGDGPHTQGDNKPADLKEESQNEEVATKDEKPKEDTKKMDEIETKGGGNNVDNNTVAEDLDHPNLQEHRAPVADVQAQSEKASDQSSRAAGLAIEVKFNIAACLKAQNRVPESFAQLADCLNLALAHHFTVWEAASCGAVGDIYAAAGLNGMKQASEFLKRKAEDVSDKVRIGVGGTRIPWLQNILETTFDQSKLDLVDGTPPGLQLYLTASEASARRLTKSQPFPPDLHMLEAIQWHERMADVANQVGPEETTGHAAPGSDHKACELQLRALGSLGTLYKQLGQGTVAIRFLTCAVKAAEEQGNARALAVACRELGGVYDTWAERERAKSWVSFTNLQGKAIQWHERAQAASSILKDWGGVGAALGAIAAGQSAQKEQHRAIELYKQALAMAKRRRDRHDEMACRMHIGLEYQALAQHRSAIEQHEEHLAVAESIQDRPAQGLASTNLGVSYTALKQHKKAFKLLGFALDVAEEGGDEVGKMKALYAVGAAHASSGEHLLAADAFSAAMDIATALGEPRDAEDAERACVGAGDANFKAGRFVEALDFYTRLVKLAQAGGKEQLEARAKGYVGNATYWITHRWGAPPHQRVAEAYSKTTPPASPRSPPRPATQALGSPRSPRDGKALSPRSPSKTQPLPSSSAQRTPRPQHATSPRSPARSNASLRSTLPAPSRPVGWR